RDERRRARRRACGGVRGLGGHCPPRPLRARPPGPRRARARRRPTARARPLRARVRRPAPAPDGREAGDRPRRRGDGRRRRGGRARLEHDRVLPRPGAARAARARRRHERPSDRRGAGGLARHHRPRDGWDAPPAGDVGGRRPRARADPLDPHRQGFLRRPRAQPRPGAHGSEPGGGTGQARARRRLREGGRDLRLDEVAPECAPPVRRGGSHRRDRHRPRRAGRARRRVARARRRDRGRTPEPPAAAGAASPAVARAPDGVGELRVTTMAAVDVGAQSGRVALGRLDGGRLELREVHRFPNVPVEVGGTLHWDVLRIHGDVLDGLAACADAMKGPVSSVGVDTWGVDFGLLDRAGRLVQNPVHHRDRRTDGAMERAFELVPARELYERTGIQLMPINTVFQLFAMAEAGDPALDVAERLLLVPDLLGLWLSGVAVCELTNASTSQCLDPRAQAWASDLLERLGIPPRLLGEVVPPGTVLGSLLPEIAERTRLRGAVVVAPATHDTASAVAAVPFAGPGAAYISSGTWSLVGLELDAPLIGDRTFAANLTNEAGVAGTYRLLRNVSGLWLLHECRRQWAREGRSFSFEELVALAAGAAPLRSLVDPNDPVFLPPGDMPARIRERCARAG